MNVLLTTGGNIVDLPEAAALSMIQQGHASMVQSYSPVEVAAVVAAHAVKAIRLTAPVIPPAPVAVPVVVGAVHSDAEIAAVDAAHAVKAARLAPPTPVETKLAADVAAAVVDLGALLSAPETSATETH